MHLGKIRDPKLNKMARELRKAILELSDNIVERVTKTRIVFRTSVNLTRIYTQSRGFWFAVKIPKSEFNIPDLDARKHQNPRWTDIRVSDKTKTDLLIKASKLAYQRIS